MNATFGPDLASDPAGASHSRLRPRRHLDVKFLLDANLSPSLLGLLRQAGHQGVDVVDLGLLAAADTKILGRGDDSGYPEGGHCETGPSGSTHICTASAQR